MVSVIGAGKWGRALYESLVVSSCITSRTKRDIKNFVSLDEALENEYLIISISTQEVYNWLKNNYKYKNHKVLVASKGIDLKEKKFLDEIYSEFIPKENLAFLSGPSFADEVMKKLPTALVINSINKDLYSKFSSFFPKFIKTYYSDDIIGAEIAGAYKNILAIASGICEGLKLGNNAKASLISRGLVEMARFGRYFGAKIETFLSLSGSGDLFLTANSTLSRNYRVGLGLAEGKSIDLILEELNEVAEGVATTKAVVEIAKDKNIYIPIANEVNNILQGKDIIDSINDLMKQD